MKEFTVSRTKALKENLYCGNCGTWIYCPEMNSRMENEKGEITEQIGEGCLHQNDKGDFLECPDCKSHYYLSVTTQVSSSQ
ncbi:MAG: hypothetical protein Q7J27_08335 [Syntrophales bacterium]|nr:hypothetical protein [Syntrophales bacterium]